MASSREPRCSPYPALLSGFWRLGQVKPAAPRLGVAGILKAAHRTPESGLGADCEIVSLDKVFEALSSTVRRKILAYLSATDLTAGEIAARFEISKPSASKHLSILENAGLVRGEKRGQFIHYSLVRDNLVNTLNGYVQEVCPVSQPLKRESKARAAGR
jgi:ArsR family transcriptional regulator, arsenate/arsenite/antimonite-responsive transcriptional repressor